MKKRKSKPQKNGKLGFKNVGKNFRDFRDFRGFRVFGLALGKGVSA